MEIIFSELGNIVYQKINNQVALPMPDYSPQDGEIS